MTPTRMRKWLENRRMTQAELAAALDVSERTVRRYLSGEVKIPLTVELAMLAIVAGLRS